MRCDAARRVIVGAAATNAGGRTFAHPTAEPLWSESWYADFVDAAQGLGGWFRLGLVANQQTAWVQALLCGPDLPTVAIAVDVPLPSDPWVVRTDGLELGHAPVRRCSATASICAGRVSRIRTRRHCYAVSRELLSS